MVIANQNRIFEIDAMRGVAALCVVLFHFTTSGFDAGFYFIFGLTGVELFFIISGFVIFLTLEKTKSWNGFVINRLSRLYPTYWFCVFFTFTLFFCTGEQHSIARLIANLTMFQSYFNYKDLDGPYWTMIVEMNFYILMLVLYLCNILKRIEIVCSILLVFISLYSTPFLSINYPHYHWLLFKYIPLLNYFPLFFLGILYYKIKTDKPTFYRYALVILCIIIQCTLFDDARRSVCGLTQLQYVCLLVFWNSFFVLYVNNSLHWLVNKLTLFLGDISYSLYLSHQYLSVCVLLPFFIRFLHINIWISFIITLGISLLISFLIVKYIERPSMNYIRNKYKQLSFKK